MRSSRMHATRSLIVSPYLIISHTCPSREQPHTPPSNHACPPGSSHACPPGSNHACPPGATTHAPRSNHACLPQEQPRMPPRATTHAPPVDRITDTCKNITFPQLRLRSVNILIKQYCDIFS